MDPDYEPKTYNYKTNSRGWRKKKGKQLPNTLRCSSSTPLTVDNGEGSVKPVNKDRCIACSILIRRVIQKSEKVYYAELIQYEATVNRLIAPRVIEENSVMCRACFRLALKVTEDQNEIKPFRLKCRMVCVVCGYSVKSKRHRVLHSDNEKERRLRDVITKVIAPHQLKDSDRLCHRCSLKYTRRSVKSQQKDKSLNLPATFTQQENKMSSMYSTNDPLSSISGLFDVNIKVEVSDVNVKEEPIAMEDIEPPPLFVAPESPKITPERSPSPPEKQNTINLANIKRAPATNSRCVVPNCKGKERIRAPIATRRQLLLENNVYVPAISRVCSHHSQDTNWDQLVTSDKALHIFTEEHIYDMVELLKHQPFIDFDDIDSMQDHVVKYLIGIEKEEFKAMLLGTQGLAELHNCCTGLAAYLMKQKNNDPYTRIAPILNMSRTTLCRLIKKVESLLKPHKETDQVNNE